MVYKNKRGITSIMLIFFVFFCLFTVVIAGTVFFGLETFDNVASSIRDINIGDQSFEETYDNTLGAGLKTVINTISISAITLLLGMIIVMIIVGVKVPNQNRLWIALDIFIIVVAFILSVYISIEFNSFINSNSTFLDIYSVDLQRASTFLLNLPFIIAIVGGLIMLVTYIPFKRRVPQVLEPFN